MSEQKAEDIKILGFDLPTIAIGLGAGAVILTGLTLVNQWRSDQQRIAENTARRQQMYYQKYYNDYYKDAYGQPQGQPAQANPQQRPQSEFDRIYVSGGSPAGEVNTIKPEHMYGPVRGHQQTVSDEMDPDMQRANQMISPGQEQGDFYAPTEDLDYDASAPENLDYNEQTGEIRPRSRGHGNQSPFGANASVPQG